QKLKKELGNMEENINFEKEIARRIKLLKDYYHVHNFSMDGIQTEVDKLIKFIDGMPESKLKHQAYITAYGWSDKEEYKTIREKEIELYGGDPDAAQRYVHEFWDKYANKSSDEEWLKGIDSEDGIVKVEIMEDSENAVGEMLFWRGACNIRLKNFAEARKDFETAAKKLNRDNSYHPNAIAGIKLADLLGDEPDKYIISTSGVTGERYRLYDGGKRLDFLEQPGFSNSNGTKNRYDCIYYFSAGMKKSSKFFDLNMREGETVGEDTLVSKNETITIVAGTFENCVHVKSTSDDYFKDVLSETWYAKDVGLVKCIVKNETQEEVYELCEYKINGGNGYMPVAAGNIWKYKNVNIPEYYQQILEFEIVSVFDEPDTGSKYIYMAALCVLRNSYENCDSDTHISIADYALPNEKPNEWDFEQAIKNLKLAVQKNSSVKASLFALNALEYFEKCKEYQGKGYRFLPSHTCGSSINIADNEIRYSESNVYSLSPFRWGSRHAENKIFGIKPFRFLKKLAGTLYSDKWIAGYSEQKTLDEGELSIKAEDGGTVTTKAGTFENYIKVTFDLALPDGANYYADNFKYMHCGTKIYYYAPNVGIVKFDCIWGDSLSSSCELSEYKSAATNGEYMPIYIGNHWIYDEMTLEEGYIARRKYDIVSGIENEFFLIDEQEFMYLGTEEEYEEFKKSKGN
ncbi:MAG: hypothetical protein FWF15_10935, partial [Oscillospiraceae bacterium]|nr:hypothetical protein [Oscillospiraceae bacterium]